MGDPDDAGAPAGFAVGPSDAGSEVMSLPRDSDAQRVAGVPGATSSRSYPPCCGAATASARVGGAAPGTLAQTGSPGAQTWMVRAASDPNPPSRGGSTPWPVTPSGTVRTSGSRAGSPNRPTARTRSAGTPASRPAPMRAATSPATCAPWE